MSIAVRACLRRLWDWIGKRASTGHLGPLGVLALLHVAVVERGLRGTNGCPVNMIPFDFVDSYSRFLVFIRDSLHAGAFPIWFPYGHAGTPFLVYPQSQLWTPVTWVLSAFTSYSLLVAQWQLLLTILFGSIGVYFLAHNLWARRSAALLAAIAFNFTSARLCNAEHLDIVTAFSIFPWVLFAIKRVAQGAPWAKPVLAMLVGVLVVSGYPGVVLLCPLWFAAWSLWLLASECGDRPARKRFALGLGLSLALAAGISSGYWLPILTSVRAFNRGDPLPADAALAQSLSPSDLWHLLYGASVDLVPSGVITDRSMRGLYFGIVALALACYALVTSRDRTTTALGVGMLAALLMSMGRAFFARVALHDYFSVMNFSRFPAGDSRAVAVLAGSLLAGGGLANLLANPEGTKRLSRILLGMILLLLVGVLWLGGIIYPGASAGAMHGMFTDVVFVEILMLLVALVCLQRFSRAGTIAMGLLLASGIDAGTHATFEATMWSVPADARVQRFVDIRSTTFDPAKALLPRVDAKALIDIPSNDAYLTKGFYIASYMPFQLKRFDTLISREFRDFLLHGPRVVGFVGTSPPENGPAFQKSAIAVDFQITRYLPDRVDYAVNLPVKTTLVFNEVYFPGWRARVDGQKTVAMYEEAGGLRALTVEAGRHTIETRFFPWTFWVGLMTTLLSWALAMGWVVRATLWPGKRRRLPSA